MFVFGVEIESWSSTGFYIVNTLLIVNTQFLNKLNPNFSKEWHDNFFDVYPW